MVGYFEKGKWVTIPLQVVPPTTLENVDGRLRRLEKIIRDSTEWHADVNIIGDSKVILCGQLCGHDFVKIYSVGNTQFANLADLLREMSYNVRPGRMDLPRGMKLRW